MSEQYNQHMKYSIVVTVFNEEKSIVGLLDSIRAQSVRPLEVIVVDGGSKDRTVTILKKYSKDFPKVSLKVFSKKGNRSIGRNYGVKKAQGDVLLFTDAGCLLHKDWVREISKPFTDKKTEVVAGYYKGEAQNAFQKALIPFVLVMKDKLDRKNFLPATRSMAIRKETFLRLGGFEERYSHNEDYVFANALKNNGIRMAFARKAIANWLPRNSLRSSFRMFYRFAVGDMEAGIVRGKVLLLFTRYLLLGYLLILSYLYKSPLIFSVVVASVVIYLVWAYRKHQKYLSNKREHAYSVLIQLMCDISVMTGSFIGAVKLFATQSKAFLQHNKIASVVILVYLSMMISIIGWGLPSVSHPFVYHMDEWHFLNAISSVATIGDPNVDGSAHTAMFYPFLSAVFLAPFILLKIINPFIVNSPFEQFQMQERIFEVLRIHTILSGVIGLVAIGVISKYFTKIPSFILIVLLCFTPTFISLSAFYKYDITLLSWTILGCLLMLLYDRTKKIRDYFLASAIMGITFATKFTALPLFAVCIVGYLLFTKRANWKIRQILMGLGVFFFTFVLLGIPNLFFGKGDLGEYFYSNLVSAPGETSNIIFPGSFWAYMTTTQIPVLFGWGFAILLLLALVYHAFLLLKALSSRDLQKYSREHFSLFIFSIFAASLIPLKVAAGGNRSMVLIAGALLMIGYFLRFIFSSRIKVIGSFGLSILLIAQIIQGYSWLDARNTLDPRQSSSRWINAYIQPSSVIGVESIPIYQYIPDITLKEYYQIQARENTKYKVEVIDAKTRTLPEYVIISREDIAPFIRKSPKTELLRRLQSENYKKIAEFSPELPLFTNNFDFYIANVGPVFPVAQVAIFKKD